MLVLDTDILIDFLRGYPPALEWLSAQPDEDLVIPIFVLMELIQGCQSKRELETMRKTFEPFYIYLPTQTDCEQALSFFEDGYLSHGLGLVDAFIAACALGLDQPLYTFNQKHFRAVPSLALIQPYPKSQTSMFEKIGEVLRQPFS